MVSIEERIKKNIKLIKSIEKLKKELIDPTLYKIEGTDIYDPSVKKCSYSGNLWIGKEVNNERQIVGEIYDVYNHVDNPISQPPKHLLYGEISLIHVVYGTIYRREFDDREGKHKLVYMNFEKIPIGILTSRYPIFYTLTKDDKFGDLRDENIIGLYRGIWHFGKDGYSAYLKLYK